MTDSSFTLPAANTQVPLSFIETAADGSVVEGAPAPVVTSSDETILTISDDGAGNVVAIRASASGGTATVSATVTNADGSTATGTLTVSVEAQVAPIANVTDVEIVPGVPS